MIDTPFKAWGDSQRLSTLPASKFILKARHGIPGWNREL